MFHLNNNVLCSIGLEYTDKFAYDAEIYQICILVIGKDLKLDKKKYPFDCLIQPENTEAEFPTHIMKYRETKTRGLERRQAANLFERWYSELGILENKRLAILGYNAPFIVNNLINWLGIHHFRRYFQINETRDLLVIARYLNDCMYFSHKQYAYDKIDFRSLVRLSGIHTEGIKYDATEKAVLNAKIYEIMIDKFLKELMPI